MNRILALVIFMLFFTACSMIQEVTVVHEVAGNKEKPPVEFPENIVNVYCGAQTGTGFPIEKNRVVTAYHVLEEYSGVQSVSVMNYSAKLIYSDEIKDVAVLDTVWEFDRWFDFEIDKTAEPLIGANYRQGDSGMPLLSEDDKVVAMLIGQRSDKSFAVVDVRYLRTLRADQEKAELERLKEERLAREEAERLEAEKLEEERRQREWVRQQEIARQRAAEEAAKNKEKDESDESSHADSGFRRGS